jgi:tRNA pseudouridine38-40 synthase
VDSPDGERRIKLTLQYDGAAFFGWQAQPAARTVQGDLEAALSRLTNRQTGVIAAGRTDRGVHATGQVASALVPPKWTPEEMMRALNAILPPDIWISSAEEVPQDFHARYDAVARSYFYRIGTVREAMSPFHRRWCWPMRDDLDLARLNHAAHMFLGEHSFLAFAKSGQPERGEMCTVTKAQWGRWSCGVQFDVTANRFLHHMVRYMVGTMVDVALQRRPASDIDRLLHDRGSLDTSPPAPAEGLFLSHVEY